MAATLQRPGPGVALAAVALDLDGTLLRTDKTIGPATLACLRRLALQGVTIVLATGRMTPTAVPVAVALGVPCALVTYNGACAYAPAHHVVPTSLPPLRLFHRPVPLDAATAVVQWCAAQRVAVNVYVDDRLYLLDDPHYRPAADRYAALTGCTYEYVPSYDIALRGRAPTKLLVFADAAAVPPTTAAEHAEAAVDRLYHDLARVVTPGDAVHLIHAEFFVEVVAADVNKGAGLAGLAAALDLPLEQVVAFGDGINDVEYLAAVGLGVAMRNGHRRAHAAAARVSAATNDDDGVGHELEAMLADGTLVLPPAAAATLRA
jgi:Cof subfamily protein (haloacid dehalogenase superfamily)